MALFGGPARCLHYKAEFAKPPRGRCRTTSIWQSQQRAEAQEKRREEKHTLQVERTKTAVAREKVKLECEIIRKEQIKTAAAAPHEELVAA